MMVRRLCLPVLAILLLAAGAGRAFADADDGLFWTESASGSLITLAYGATDPRVSPVFLLSCFNSMNVAVLDLHKEVLGSTPKAPLTIALSGDAGRAELVGETAMDDSTGTTFAEATEIKVKPILTVLRSAAPVTLTMGQTSLTLSARGRADAVNEFSKVCKLD